MSIVWDVNAGKPVSAPLPTREADRLADALELENETPYVAILV